MMKRSAAFMLGLAMTGMSMTLYAQSGEEPATLTFSEALRIALRNNVTLNQEKNNLFSAEVQKTQSMVAFLPGVQINGSAVHSDGQQPNPDGGELLDLSVDNVNANIEAGLTVFNGFNRINTTMRASNLLKAQTSNVKRTEQDVVANVANQYLQVMLDQELLRIAEETYNAQVAVLDQLKEQVRLGARAESDLYTQEAQVSNLRVTALRAKVTLENDKALLAQTLQLDPAVPFSVQLPDRALALDYVDMNLDSLYQVALTNREDLHRAEYQAKANQYAYRAAISGYLPSVTLFASYGSQYISTLKENALYGGFSNQFTNIFPSTSYGVTVTIPVFDRFVTRSNRVLNKVTYENSVLEKENLEKSIKIDVKRTYNNYLTAIQSYEASQVQHRAGELALKTQQESLILGVVSPVDLAQATQTYVQGASSQAQAEVTLMFQKILLEYALGTLNVSAMVE